MNFDYFKGMNILVDDDITHATVATLFVYYMKEFDERSYFFYMPTINLKIVQLKLHKLLRMSVRVPGGLCLLILWRERSAVDPSNTIALYYDLLLIKNNNNTYSNYLQ